MKIRVKVTPRVKKEKIKEGSGFLRVYLREPPLEDRANKRLIEVLAKHFNVKKGDVNIVKGKTAREKIIEISEIG